MKTKKYTGEDLYTDINNGVFKNVYVRFGSSDVKADQKSVLQMISEVGTLADFEVQTCEFVFINEFDLYIIEYSFNMETA